MNEKTKAFLEYVKISKENEPEFLQAVHEVAETILPFIKENPKISRKNAVGTHGRA